MILAFHRNECVMFYKMPQQMRERESTGANDGCAAIIPRLDRSSSNGYHKPARAKRISKPQVVIATYLHFTRSKFESARFATLYTADHYEAENNVVPSLRSHFHTCSQKATVLETVSVRSKRTLSSALSRRYSCIDPRI